MLAKLKSLFLKQVSTDTYKINNVLFLDFDGVLHPYQSGSFIHLGKLEMILRNYPFVNVVISSSWRESSDMEYLRSQFSEDIRERVIDCTPVLGYEAAYPREKEILGFVAKHEVTHWIALDDDSSLFSNGFTRLLKTSYETGLTHNELTKLVSIFSEWSVSLSMLRQPLT